MAGQSFRYAAPVWALRASCARVVALARELGLVLTALMIAARAGSAIAAELGSMQATEQIDAPDSDGDKPGAVLGIAAPACRRDKLSAANLWRFTEGFDLPDLKEAKALLERLSRRL